MSGGSPKSMEALIIINGRKSGRGLKVRRRLKCLGFSKVNMFRSSPENLAKHIGLFESADLVLPILNDTLPMEESRTLALVLSGRESKAALLLPKNIKPPTGLGKLERLGNLEEIDIGSPETNSWLGQLTNLIFSMMIRFQSSRKTSHDTPSSNHKSDIQNLAPSRFMEAIHLFEEETAEDLVTIEKAKADCLYWRKYVLALPGFLDQLCDGLFRILEADPVFCVIKDRKLLTLPIHFSKIDYAAALRDLAQRCDQNPSFTNMNALTNMLQEAPLVSVRNGSELDYRHQVKDHPSEVALTLKKNLSGLLLILKQLKYKANLELLRLLQTLMNREKALWKQPATPYNKILFEALCQETGSSMEQLLEVEADLHANYVLARDLEALSEQTRNGYTGFLDRSVFRCYNDIRQAGLYFDRQELIDPERPTVYQELLAEFQQKLMELDLEPIDVERGQKYDPEYHNPYTQAEPDPELEDDQIKEVINQGFQTRDKHILKTADVVVVRN